MVSTLWRMISYYPFSAPRPCFWSVLCPVIFLTAWVLMSLPESETVRREPPKRATRPFRFSIALGIVLCGTGSFGRGIIHR